RLCDALAARGIARAFLTIGLTQRGQKSGLSRDVVGQLVELILQGRDSAEVEWDGVQVAEHSEALSDYVNSIRLYKGPELDRVYINIPLFARPAGDGRWIKAAVDRKVARYGNAN